MPVQPHISESSGTWSNGSQLMSFYVAHTARRALFPYPEKTCIGRGDADPAKPLPLVGGKFICAVQRDIRE